VGGLQHAVRVPITEDGPGDVAVTIPGTVFSGVKLK